METATAKTNSLATALINELKHEAIATRKCLERIPAEKFDYKPHEKSMTFGQLAAHIAEMIGWITVTAKTTELDFATGYTPFEPKTSGDLIEFFEKNMAEAIEGLENSSDEDLQQDWTLRNGEQVYFTMTRIQCMRDMCGNHIVHHRGQLTVYLRLNDIPVPSLYGPSADEGQM